MMTSDELAADDYLSSTRCTFWRWAGGFGVATWPEGDTIAFTEEIQAVLQRLAPGGLPPLGSVLLLLAATRDSWRQVHDKAGVLSRILQALPPTAVWKDLLYDVLEGLTRVHLFDDELRKPLEAKRRLAEVVFQDCSDRTTVDVAHAVLKRFEAGLSDAAFDAVRQWDLASILPQELYRELRALRAGLQDVSAESLWMRSQTGLEELVRPAPPVELPTHLRARGLLAELVDDPELHGVAGLARRLTAAVTLPRQLSERSEYQDGGVSDIANRGRLDRLLLSELAHDDLTLAVRVAVNEALYLRRESPPRPPSRKRAILLDSGLRTWGLPRAFSTAAALAVAANGDEKTECRVFRAAGTRVKNVDLTTREGLVEHLKVLEPELHCGRALGAFFQAAAQFDFAEPILIVAEETFADPEFRQELDAQKAYPVTVAAVNRDGDLTLVVCTAAGVRPWRKAKLDLQQVFSGRRRQTSLLDPSKRPDLPAIFSVRPFPLFLTANLHPRRCCVVDQRGVLQVTADRRLLWWTSPGIGAEQLADSLPRRDPCAFLLTDDGRTAIVAFQRNTKNQAHFLRVDLRDREWSQFSIPVDQPIRSVAHWHGRLLIFLRNRIVVVDPTSGTVLNSSDCPKASRVSGRFLRIGWTWKAVGLAGAEPTLEDVPGQRELHFETVFECPGIEGPIAVAAGGRFYFPTTRTFMDVDHRLTGRVNVPSISHDGRLVALTNSPPQAPKCVVASPLTGHVYPLLHGNSVALCGAHKYAYVRSLRNRFRAVAVLPNGRLALKNFSGRWNVISLRSLRAPLFLEEAKEMTCAETAFKPHPRQCEFGFKLQRAVRPDGSEIVLDSRGLLHLRSSDKRIPELSIVLSDRALSGWCSTGKVWGDPFLVGDRNHAEPWQIYETVLTPFCERAR